MQSIRYGVSLHATVIITTSAFIDPGLITEEDKGLVDDHNKIKRVQENVMNSINEEL